jgi:hypothetical protein
MATPAPGGQAKAQGKPCAFLHARLSARVPRLSGRIGFDIAGLHFRQVIDVRTGGG